MFRLFQHCDRFPLGKYAAVLASIGALPEQNP
jgi:hypothetical protein